MFRKAQLKLFAIITSILLAIFIAVLGSVNIIMQAVMQRQSKDVLKKIAAGVEYDEKTSRFNITRPENFGQKPQDEPPFKPDDKAVQPPTEDESETTVTTASSSTSSQTTTSTVTTDTKIPATENTVKASPPEALTTSSATTAERPKVSTKPATTSHIIETTTEDDGDDDDDDDHKKERDYKPPWWVKPGDESMPFVPPPPWDNGNKQPFTFPESDDDERQPFTFPDRYRHDNGHQPYTFPNWNNGKNDDDEGDNEDLSAVSPDYTDYLVPLGNEAGSSPDDIKVSDFEENVTHRGNMNDSIPRSLGTIDFFIVMADKDGNYMAQLNNEDLDQETAQKYISAILKDKSSSGMIDDRYQFYQMEKSNGTIMVFTDKSAEIDMLRKLNRTTIIIGTVSLLFLIAAAFFLSRQVMKPLRTAFDKQKQFISDASHELKTPLTVISANADVLSGEIGENRWLNYIKSQIDRMNVLVNDLLNLTRLENNSSDFIRTDFNLSKAVVNTALPFECQAFESDKQFDVDVEEGLTVNGSERHIKQMVAIFIDNALKYSGDGGKVRVTLRKQGDKKVLTVFNTGKGVRSGEEDKIFERFYRSDESRNRSTGGYGLGLAIAKSIIDKHKFKIHVENDEGRSIAFVVTM